MTAWLGALLVTLLAGTEVRSEDGGGASLPPPRVIQRRAATPAVPPPPPVRIPPPVTAPAAPAPSDAARASDGPPLALTRPPPRPTGPTQQKPEDFLFEVDPHGGEILVFPAGKDRLEIVGIGNPRIRGYAHTRPDGQAVDSLQVKANSVVLLVDLTKTSAFSAFGGLAGGEDGGEPAKQPSNVASVIQEAVLGLYAEGAVELTYGNLAFRAPRLYLEPPTYKALLLEPRFTGQVEGIEDISAATGDGKAAKPLPIHVRARQARLVGKGVAVFDEAEVSLSRADDRMALQVRRLTVREEQAKAAAGADGDLGTVPTLLGFRNIENQTFEAEAVRLRGERLPLAYWGNASFEYPFSRNFPVRIRGFQTGNRSSQGRYANVTLGGTITRDKAALFDWDLILGGSFKRGPSGGGRITWDRTPSRGKAFYWNTYEFGHNADGSGFDPPQAYRWIAELESRTDLSKKLQFDFEFNAFSDAGVNVEYFENDALTHKDRESYGRLRYTEDLAVATLTGKWHQRSYVTETTEVPELGLWTTAIPLRAPQRRGGLGVDLVSSTHAGFLQRKHAAGGDVPDYQATRLRTRTTANLGLDVGDVRLAAHAGLDGVGYVTRSVEGEDEPDLWRGALVCGARANLQLHRTWNKRGGMFQLNRLRHIIDLDLGFRGRYFDETDPLEAPYFDYRDLARERTAGELRVRNRLQTRGRDGEIRNLLDLDVSYYHFVDDRGPLLEDVPGWLDVYLRARPRERVYVAGEGDWDLGAGVLDKGYFGGGFQGDDLSCAVGIRYIRDRAVAPVIDLSWRFSEKYGFRAVEQYDFKVDENYAKFILGRYSPDHAFFFGLSQRGTEVAFQFNFVTSVGRGGLEADRTFNDQPTADRWGVFE